MRKLLLIASAMTMLAGSAWAGCNTQGNCYQKDGNGGYQGYNERTGSTWSGHSNNDGSQSGYNKRGESWSSQPSYNSGYGRRSRSNSYGDDD